MTVPVRRFSNGRCPQEVPLATASVLRHTLDMTLEGWDHIPHGYSAEFDLTGAPLWLRQWFRTPFLDRYAHPLVVARGYAYLTMKDFVPAEEREPVASGWKLREADYRDPGAAYGTLP